MAARPGVTVSGSRVPKAQVEAVVAGTRVLGALIADSLASVEPTVTMPQLRVLILAGRVFGPGFGFVLGCTSLFASALLTGGVGPWLPFQMLVSAWVGMGAGLLPRRATGRVEIALLAAYGVVSAYAFGLLMNLSSWPFVLGLAVPGHTGLSFVPGDPLSDNHHRFLAYTLITATGSFDTGRAITNAVGVVVLGPAVLATLRRAARRVVVVGVVENALPGSGGPPSLGPDDEPESREEAVMSTPHPGLRSEAGSQI